VYLEGDSKGHPDIHDFQAVTERVPLYFISTYLWVSGNKRYTKGDLMELKGKKFITRSP
jgi:hypothetical protein